MLGVLIVDDHPVVRSGIRDMLACADDIEVVGEAATAEEAIVVAPRLHPDVILTDLRMPGEGGLVVIQELAGQYRVIALSAFDRRDDVRKALEAGAAGYLLKHAGRAELIDAIRQAAAGGPVGAPAGTTSPDDPVSPSVSSREGEVLGLVAQGMTNAEIARRLHIGEATVKTHLLRAFAKLGASDRTTAVLAAMRQGILPLPGSDSQ